MNPVVEVIDQSQKPSPAAQVYLRSAALQMVSGFVAAKPRMIAMKNYKNDGIIFNTESLLELPCKRREGLPSLASTSSSKLQWQYAEDDRPRRSGCPVNASVEMLGDTLVSAHSRDVM